MFIKREIDAFLARRMFSGKVLVVYGPRQSGKTTAIEHYLEASGLAPQTATFNGDETADRELLADASAERLKLLIGNKKVLFIDEAFASNVRNGQGFVTAWKNANSTTSGMNACAIDCSGNPHRFWYWDERTGTPVWTSKTKGTGAWPNE